MFEIGQRVRVRETEVTMSQPENMYPGEEGTVVGQEAVYTRVHIDNVREDDLIGRAIIAVDGGWLYDTNELEAI